jgi:2-haloalkanoic acid dehalogenase type II
MNGLQIKVIFFDYYGTLVQMEKPFQQLKEWFHTTHIQRQTKVSANEFFMFFSRQRASLLCPDKFLTGYQTLVGSYHKTCKKFHISPENSGFRSCIESLFSDTTAYEDALLTIEKLHHTYQIGILTNADNDLLKESMKKHRFVVDYVITSEDAKCNKPWEGIFMKAVNTAKTKAEQILIIGDSLTDDIMPAQDMGFNTIWINRNNQEKTDEKMLEVKALKEVLQLF